MSKESSEAGKRSRRPLRRGHFLTHRDVEFLREGPEPVQRTRRKYGGKRFEQERRTYKVAYARVVRESTRDARGALEDLAFLAETLGPDWLYDLVTETRPLHEPSKAEVPESFDRERIMLTGYKRSPLEAFLEAVAEKVGWLKWPEKTVGHGELVKEERAGERVAVRLLAALERGLNDDPERPSHRVGITSRIDPSRHDESGVVGLKRKRWNLGAYHPPE